MNICVTLSLFFAAVAAAAAPPPSSSSLVVVRHHYFHFNFSFTVKLIVIGGGLLVVALLFLAWRSYRANSVAVELPVMLETAGSTWSATLAPNTRLRYHMTTGITAVPVAAGRPIFTIWKEWWTCTT
ncbi:hypothetical protein TSUD_231880 [Trifolium subterraneum]|uniref:Uncharacterized protein n=1 Tax=Trifolium subterraneum TaxID=3900 RepID=A0A2Z6PFL4_TRISU|nr:hypothetical protein TSUD_231880 [Trifolium subterraneum]